MAFAPVSPLSLDGLNKFLSMTYHHFINYAIYTFAELGLADRLLQAAPDRGCTVEEIMGENLEQWNTHLLYRLLRACVYGGIVQLVHDDKHFILTTSGMMLTSDHSSRVRDHVRFHFGSLFTSAALQLPNIVRNEGTGTGIARVSSGLDFYTLMERPDQKELLAVFAGCMTAFSIQTGVKLVTGVDFSRFRTVVDHGGNRGTFLAQILQSYPAIEHGIVFDLPRIIDQFKNGEEFTSREVIRNKWSFLPGDMFDSSTIPSADAYILKRILHNHDDDKCLAILSAIRQANETRKSSPTTVFIVEHIILPNGALSNWQTHGLDMGMAILFDNARERTPEEYEQLLKQSGFELKKLYPIEAPDSIIEATFVPQTRN